MMPNVPTDSMTNTQAKGGNATTSGSFASRAQSAGDRNANANAGGGMGGKSGSQGGGKTK